MGRDGGRMCRAVSTVTSQGHARQVDLIAPCVREKSKAEEDVDLVCTLPVYYCPVTRGDV